MNLFTTILVEFLLIVSSILLLFKFRSRIGLAPLYILLGAVQYLQANLGSSFSFNIFGDYQIYPGSIILFSGLLFAVLLIYIKEGVASARALIIGILVSNIIMTLMFEITYLQQIAENQINNTSVNSDSVFNINFKYFISGTAILLLDFLFLVIIYQYLISRIKKPNYFLILFISLFSILIFDAFAFNFALFYGTPLFKTSLVAHLLGKSIAGIVFSSILYLYVKYIDNETTAAATFIADQNRDIFSILKYRKRYKDLKLEKEQVEQKLTSQLETTLNNISDGFVSLDTNWCYTFVNIKAGELLGKTPESLIGKHIWTEFPEGVGLPFHDVYYKAVETQQTQYFQEYYEPFDKWFENKVYPSKDGLTIYFTDVTEKRKADLALKESENHLRTILETEPECIKQLNSKGELIYMNPAGLAMIEADNLEMVKGQPMIDLIIPKHQRAFKKLAHEVFKGNSGQLAFEIKGLKGTNRWLETHAVPLRDSEGNIISLLGVTRDVSDRKKVEEQLVNSEQLFRRLSSKAPVAIFQTDQEGYCNYVNEQWMTYSGMSFEAAMGFGWANAIHPDDKERVMHEVEQSILTGTENVMEYRFLNSQKQTTWLSTKTVELRDAQNNLYGYIGIAVDITDRKNAEKLLKESEKYLDSIINNIGDPVFVKDDKSHFLLANNAFLKLFNRTKEEIIGKTFAEDVPLDERERYLSIDKKVIDNGIENVDEDSFNVKGETRFTSTKKTRFIDDSGKKHLIGIIRDITEQKNAENLLIESKNYLDSIINNIGDPVFVKDEESQVLLVNDSFCSFFNLSKADIIGKTLAENIPPEEMEIFFRIDKQVISTGIENVNEETLTVNNNETKIISTKKTRFVDASGNKFLIGVIRDVTEQKVAEENLKETHSQLNLAVESAKLGVWSINLKTGYLEWNDELFKIYGVDPTKFDNTMDAFQKLVHPEDLEYVMSHQGAVSGFEFRIVRPNKEVRFINGSVLPVIVNGEVAKIIGINEDVTERKMAEAELEKHRNNLEELVEVRTTELEKEKVKAQSADLMKSAFLATMSHELRTPMNSIIGFTSILLNGYPGPLNEEQKKQLSMVKTSGQHLLGLINDVLDISKIEAGKLIVTLSPFNYLATLNNTIDFLLPQASKKELIINSEISETTITLNSDERRVEQVLLNFLSNAIKFSNNGSIQVKVDIVDDFLVTQVIDQGIGIDKKGLNKLFMPFIQIDGGLNRSHEGTGLGLAICKNLIEKLGGSIQVQSKKGKGSNFTFKLPIEPFDN